MMSGMWLAVLICCALLAAALLFAERLLRQSKPSTAERFASIFKQGEDEDDIRTDNPRLKFSLAKLLDRFEVLTLGANSEIARLLVQSGWSSGRSRYFYLILARIGPVILGAITLFASLARHHGLGTALLHAMFAFALAFVGLRYLLRWRASVRLKALRRELAPLLHLLRMLLDAGLSLEHALRVAVEQGGDLIPNFSVELERVLVRITAGQDRGEALTRMAELLDIPEVTDMVAMLRQVTRFGGNIRDSLASYSKLLEERQLSELREYVSKLSAKMTVVMMVFMFPALMIFIAGPGFMGLTKALGSVG